MFTKIFEFESALTEYTGAPYAIMTDCCTHAIELCLRYDKVTTTSFTAFTYLSVPMTMHKLNIHYTYVNEQWSGEYQFYHTRIWDSARKLERNMYKKGAMQCLSFGNGKPLQIGRGGAILLDDREAYTTMLAQRYDGRDLTISPWESQTTFNVGFHYRPTIEEAILGLKLLSSGSLTTQPTNTYPDCRKIRII
jgi:dTDP-4-amino-4,6-dideoxygalactose transaminase